MHAIENILAYFELQIDNTLLIVHAWVQFFQNFVN